MKIEFDQAQMEKAVSDASIGAFKSAMEAWGTQEAISKAIANETTCGVIATAINTSLEGLNVEELVRSLTVEIGEAIKMSVRAVLRESTVSVVMRLRGISSFDQEKMAPTIAAELFGETT